MPKYAIIITRDITESTVIEVEADTQSHAEAIALEHLRRKDSVEWTLDEGSWNNGDAYVTGIDLVPGA